MKFLVILIVTACSGVSTLHAQAPAIITQSPSRALALWAGGNVTLSVDVSGTGPFTYQWQLNSTNLPESIINTVVGGTIIDGVVATTAYLNHPEAVTSDTAGNLFIADFDNNRVRKVSTNGIITTVAGNGTSGYSGDGVIATNANLNRPRSLALDAVGNLFIADEFNHRIRKMDTDGIISTVAGNGTSGYWGDGGAATNARLNYPFDVTVDIFGNLFIADNGNNCIRKVDTSGIITTVAGTGTSGFSGDGGLGTNATLKGPTSVTVDSAGNIFIGDFSNYRVRKVNTNGIITTVAGKGVFTYSGDGGAAVNAGIGPPWDVEVDAMGNLLIGDFYNYRVRKVSTNGIITTVAGNGTSSYSGDGGSATSATLNGPMGIAADRAGNLLIADSNNCRVRKVNSNGIITTVAGAGRYNYAGDNIAAINATLSSPFGLAVDTGGNLFIGDVYNNRVRKVNTNGIISTVAGRNSVGFSGDDAAATNASLNYPESVAVDSIGNLFIADVYNNRIRKVSTNGFITTVAGKGGSGYSGDGAAATNASLNYPRCVTVDAAGNLFIADELNHRIREVNTNGVISTVAGNGISGFSGDGGAATNARLNQPYRVTVDVSGNIFIADGVNRRIRRVATNGTITTVAGNGTFGYSGDGGIATNASFSGIYGVAVDVIGNMFLGDLNNSRIRKVSTDSIITTVAGTGDFGFSGDGGIPTYAKLNSPSSIALDIYGNMFIADTQNNRIRKVTDTRGPVLALNGVNVADAGSYRVVVTGSSGSATSSVVNLIVTTSPIIYETSRNQVGDVSLKFVSQPNSTNVVLCATNFLPPIVWQPLSTNLAGADGNWQCIDTNAPNSETRFYRSITK